MPSKPLHRKTRGLSCGAILLAASLAYAPACATAHAQVQVLEANPQSPPISGVVLRSEPVQLGRLAQAAPEENPSGGEHASPQSQKYGSGISRIVSDSAYPLVVAAGAFLLADGKHHGGQVRGAIEGVGVSMLATLALKRVVRSERPRGGAGSFPSGHATAAFAVASSVGYNHRNLRLPLLGVATAIAASRVDLRAHRVRDVVAGGVIGYFGTRYFMRRNRDESTSSTLSAQTPFPAAATLGLSLSAQGVNFSRGF